jgi:type 1 glutamine amidotransferase
MTRTPLALVALAALVSAAPAQDRIGLLIITGSHRHDWVNTTPVMVRFLEAAGRFKVAVTEDPRKDLTPENLARYGVFLLHYRETTEAKEFPVLDGNGAETGQVRQVPAAPGRWPEANEKALLGEIENGKGLVVVHYATSAFDEGDANWPEYERLIGGGWRVTKDRFGHGSMFQFKVKIADKTHPITRGFPEEFLHSKDELYHNSLMVEGNQVLLTGFDDPDLGGEQCTGKDENLGWVREYGKGRVFTTVLGHGPEQMRLSPGFQALVSRGAEWAATGKATLPVPSRIDADPAE